MREVGELVTFLKTQRGKTGKLVLMGHSTGAQVCVCVYVSVGFMLDMMDIADRCSHVERIISCALDAMS